MGGSSIAGGFVFRALHALNRLKPRIEKGSPPRAAFNAHYVSAALDCVLCLSSLFLLEKLHIQSLNKRQVDCHINQNQYELK